MFEDRARHLAKLSHPTRDLKHAKSSRDRGGRSRHDLPSPSLLKVKPREIEKGQEPERKSHANVNFSNLLILFLRCQI